MILVKLYSLLKARFDMNESIKCSQVTRNN